MPIKKKNTSKRATSAKQTLSNQTTKAVNIETVVNTDAGMVDIQKQFNAKRMEDSGDLLAQTTREALGIIKEMSSCTDLRPNGDTCLAEYEKAQNDSRQFSHDQLKSINNLKNLCSFCESALFADEIKTEEN